MYKQLTSEQRSQIFARLLCRFLVLIHHAPHVYEICVKSGQVAARVVPILISLLVGYGVPLVVKPPIHPHCTVGQRGHRLSCKRICAKILWLRLSTFARRAATQTYHCHTHQKQISKNHIFHFVSDFFCKFMPLIVAMRTSICRTPATTPFCWLAECL